MVFSASLIFSHTTQNKEYNKLNETMNVLTYGHAVMTQLKCFIIEQCKAIIKIVVCGAT